MYGYKRLSIFTFFILLFLTVDGVSDEKMGKYQLANTISDEALQAWNISVFPDGRNLPEGEGRYEVGKKLYESQCVACHGVAGEGGVRLDPYRGQIEKLVRSENDSLTSGSPQKSIGTYWQYAPLIFDYIRRTMPYQAPKSLSNNEVYALTAYLLAENGIISKSLVVDKKSLAKIKMPNIDGFVCDNRVDTKSALCMKNCLLPSDKKYQWLPLERVDNLKSDCLIPPSLVFGSNR